MLQAIAESNGIRLQVVEARGADSYGEAFAAIVHDGGQAVIVLNGPEFVYNRVRIVELANRHRLPSAFQFADFVSIGGLVSYGPDIADLSARAAAYVDKILKGANPAELPIEQPRRFFLVINRKTASMLGLRISPALLLQADQVIRDRRSGDRAAADARRPARGVRRIARSLPGVVGLKAIGYPVARASARRSGADSPVTNAHDHSGSALAAKPLHDLDTAFAAGKVQVAKDDVRAPAACALDRLVAGRGRGHLASPLCRAGPAWRREPEPRRRRPAREFRAGCRRRNAGGAGTGCGGYAGGGARTTVPLPGTDSTRMR